MGSSTEDDEKYITSQEDVQSALKDMDLTKDEVGKFEKAFKDPEFLKMFCEYAKEIEDPACRAETDQYLRQVEAEGRTKEVYGDNVTLITPAAGFVIKTRKKEDDSKVFINVCHSDKVENATSDKQKGGTTWNVPFSLSAIRKEKDHRGQDCDTHDFVVNSETFRRAEELQPFRKFLIDTAIEHVQKQRYGQYEKQRSEAATLDTRYKCPNIKYKGPKEGPGVLAIKKEAGGGPSEEGARIQPKKTPSSFGGVPIPDQSAQDKGIKEKMQMAEKAKQEEAAAKASRSGFDFNFKKPKAKAEVGLVEPQYEVVHRGALDLQEAWDGAADGRTKLHNPLPRALVVRVQLPRLDSVAGVDLDVSQHRILLSKPEMYRLDLKLPYKVDDSKGKAKFDKACCVLELVLPVVPPPKALKRWEEPKPLVEVMDDSEVAPDAQHKSDDNEHEAAVKFSEASEEKQLDGVVARATPSGGDSPHTDPSTAATSSKVEESDPDTNAKSLKSISPSELAWKEMMDLHDEKRRAADAAEAKQQLAAELERVKALAVAPSSTNVVPAKLTTEFFASPVFEGARLGYVFKRCGDNVGYYLDKKEAAKYDIPLDGIESSAAETGKRPKTASAETGVSTPATSSETTLKSLDGQPVPQTKQPDSTAHVLAPRLFAGDVLELD